MIELTERARIISHEASTKVTSAMRDMIGAAAGIAGFAVESARDLVQYMVRRGQMTQEEADKLIREAEATHLKKPKAERDRIAAEKKAAEKAAAEKKAARTAAETALPVHRVVGPGRLLAQGAGKTVKTPPAPAKPGSPPAAPEKMTAKPAAKTTASAGAAKPEAKPTAAKAPASKAPVAKAAPAKAAAKAAKSAPAKKAAAKPAAKKAVKKKR